MADENKHWEYPVTKGLLKAFGDKSKKLFLPKTAYTVDNHSYIYLDVNLGLDFKDLYLKLLCLSNLNDVIAPVDSIIVITSDKTALTFASCVNEGKHLIKGIKFYTVDDNLKTILKVVVQLTGETDACSVYAYNTEKEEIVIDKITFGNSPSSYSWQIGYSGDNKIGEVYNNSSDSPVSSVTFDIVKDEDEKDSYPAKTEFDTIETSTKTKKLDHDLNFKYDFTHRNDGTSSDSIGDLSSNDLILPIPDLSLFDLDLSTSKEAGSYIVNVVEENSLRTIGITPFPEASLSKLGGIKLYENGDITTTGVYPVKLDNEGRAYIEINNEQEEHPAIIYMGTVDVYSDADKTGGQTSLQEKTQEAKLGHLYTCRTNNQEYIRNNITYSDYDNNNWKDCWEYVGEVFKAYTPGAHIVIDENREISTTGLQETLTEGENIHIDGNTISATDTTYAASDFDIKDLTDSTNLRTSWSSKQDAINDLEAIRSGASLGATALQSIPSEYIIESELNEALSEKQDVISDLNTIRSGAELGATALLSFTEIDPTVPNWAKLQDKPSYNLDEVADGTNRKLENTATLKVISNNSGNHITTEENSDKKITFTGGEDKFTVTDGEDSFEISVTHTNPDIPELLQATAESLGGIKLMDNTPVTVDDKTYYVKLTSGGVAAVNVPWTANQSTQYLGTISGSDSLINNPHKGDYYLVSDTWTYNGQSYQPGTQVVYNGVTWDIVSTNIAPATSNPYNISSTTAIGNSVKYAREDHQHAISVLTGDGNGEVKIAGQNATVKGLKSAAYKDTTDTYSANGTDPTTGKAIKDAIDGLDNSGTSNILASKTIKSWSESDGIVSITTQDIAIANTQVSGLGDSATKNVGTASGTVAAGNHTHTLNLAATTSSTAVGQTLAYDTMYKLTAGGNDIYFKTPTDTNTTYTFAEGSTNGAFQVTPSGGSAQSVAVHGVLTSHQTIKLDGITGATIKRYGTCITAANTAEKTVNISNGTFSLESGAKVTVKFSNSNLNSSPTLNVNSTGAKSIYCDGAAIDSNNLNLISGICDFIYDGTNWNLINKFNKVEKVLTETTPSSVGTINKGYQLLFDSKVFNNAMEYDSSNVGKVAESTKLYFDPGPNSNSSGTLYTDKLNVAERIDCEELHALTDIVGNDITCNGVLTVYDGIIASSDLRCDIGDDAGGAFNEIHAATLHLASRGDDDSGHDQSYGGKITFGDGGYCYIEENPDDVLKIHSNAELYLNTDNDEDIYLEPASNVVYVSGQVNATSGFYDTSDARKKDIISNISLNKAYELVDKCQTILFSFKDDEEKKYRIGVLAQEIKEYFPEIVTEDSEGFLSVDYSKLSVILMSVIRDMKSKMSSFEDRLLKLENKLN